MRKSYRWSVVLGSFLAVFVVAAVAARHEALSVTELTARTIKLLSGGGIDANTAGTLSIGASTATKVEVAGSGVETEVQGTLDVLQAANFVGNATLAAQLIALPQTSTVTNGAVLTLSGVANNVTASGASTVTVADPGTAGRFALLCNVGTDNITIAKGANIALSDATVVVTPHGTLWLYASATNAWKEVSNSKDNAVD